MGVGVHEVVEMYATSLCDTEPIAKKVRYSISFPQLLSLHILWVRIVPGSSNFPIGDIYLSLVSCSDEFAICCLHVFMSSLYTSVVSHVSCLVYRMDGFHFHFDSSCHDPQSPSTFL